MTQKMKRSAPIWFATVTLLVAIVALGASGIALAKQMSDNHNQIVREANKAVEQCESNNETRFGGADYTRPIIRSLVKRVGLQKVIADVTEEGFSASLVDLRDIPKIDCKTGKQIPVPFPPTK